MCFRFQGDHFSRRSTACLAARARICSRMSIMSSLSSISDPNWISGSSQVEAALLDELALGAIIRVINNKFNLLSDLVPLMGPRRLIPMVKTQYIH